ncbi:hypothetical protein KM043_007796 [Ampulex compressa]|nr:hypothetical protein KM043_007796 [Ampulex compressa]
MSSDTNNNLLRVNNNLCYFSPNGQFLVVAFQTNVIVRSAETLDTCQLYVFPDLIEYLEWSLDSEYILCANIKKGVVQVYSIFYPQWKFKLVEGSAGLESVTWSPDSRHILTLSDFSNCMPYSKFEIIYQ